MTAPAPRLDAEGEGLLWDPNYGTSARLVWAWLDDRCLSTDDARTLYLAIDHPIWPSGETSQTLIYEWTGRYWGELRDFLTRRSVDLRRLERE